MFPRRTESVGVFLDTEAEIVRSLQAYRVATNQTGDFEGLGPVVLLSAHEAQIVLRGLGVRAVAQANTLQRLEKRQHNLQRWERFIPRHRWQLRHTEVSCQLIEQRELRRETTEMQAELSLALDESRESVAADWLAAVENELTIAEQRGVPVFDDSL